jgi:hypothetical protein
MSFRGRNAPRPDACVLGEETVSLCSGQGDGEAESPACYGHIRCWLSIWHPETSSEPCTSTSRVEMCPAALMYDRKCAEKSPARSIHDRGWQISKVKIPPLRPVYLPNDRLLEKGSIPTRLLRLICPYRRALDGQIRPRIGPFRADENMHAKTCAFQRQIPVWPRSLRSQNGL